jgi:hypothetical protein
MGSGEVTDRPPLRVVDGPWWVNATERGSEYSAVEWALVDAGLADWTGSRDRHPSDLAMVAIGALRAWEQLSQSPSVPRGGEPGLVLEPADPTGWRIDLIVEDVETHRLSVVTGIPAPVRESAPEEPEVPSGYRMAARITIPPGWPAVTVSMIEQTSPAGDIDDVVAAGEVDAVLAEIGWRWRARPDGTLAYEDVATLIALVRSLAAER